MRRWTLSSAIVVLAAISCSSRDDPPSRDGDIDDDADVMGDADVTSDGDTDVAPPERPSPFGVHDLQLQVPAERDEMALLGASATRLHPATSLIWDLVETERGVYDWTRVDLGVTRAQELDVAVFATLAPQARIDGTEVGSAAMPNHLDWYLEFVRAAAERYDGDGLADAPGSPRIDVIQLHNELDTPGMWTDTTAAFAELLAETTRAVREVAPSIRVALAGLATPMGYDEVYRPMLDELDGLRVGSETSLFDLFDVHWSGQFPGDDDYTTIELPGQSFELCAFLDELRADFRGRGYPELPFVITEMTDYSGTPVDARGVPYREHSEAYHAAALVKRYLYALGCGVEIVYWSQLVELHAFGGVENGYFDNVGLINNPANDGTSHRKLAFHSYRLLISRLGDRARRIPAMVADGRDGTYAYRLEGARGAPPIWVAWRHDFYEASARALQLTGIEAGEVRVTEAVPRLVDGSSIEDPDAPELFDERTLEVENGRVTLDLDEIPVLVEPLP